ncbi:MAG TPA: hypothetical protein VK588_12375 [Chitinophagaceae bacterium]|nr:hypothetical protein [Chitinophagaceae bacterium]
MKKTFFLAGIAAFLLTLSVNAQQDSTAKPAPMQQDSTMPVKPTQSQPATTTTQDQKQQTTSASVSPDQKKYGNPTVDSILSKYTLVPMPNQMTTEQIFPVIGQFQSSTNADQKLTIVLDDQNKGFVWIDGLPQGKVKGVLKKSPATYKIPAQKTAEGTDVPEGTLIYDKDTKVITVMLGRPFNDQDPASVFATTTTEDQSTASSTQADDQSKATVTKTKGTKTKTKVVKKAPEPAPWVFTGTKVEQVTATNQ